MECEIIDFIYPFGLVSPITYKLISFDSSSLPPKTSPAIQNIRKYLLTKIPSSCIYVYPLFSDNLDKLALSLHPLFTRLQIFRVTISNPIGASRWRVCAISPVISRFPASRKQRLHLST